MRKLLQFILVCFTVLTSETPISESAQAKNVRYIYEIEGEADAAGNEYIWRTRPIYFEAGELTFSEEVFALYSDFFKEAFYAVPDGVCVLGVNIADGVLTVNVSGEILNYGGNANENALLAQCLENARNLPGVAYFTLLIDGQPQYLPEGRLAENIGLR